MTTLTTSPPPSSTITALTPPSPPSPRFTLELEFVLSLSNPYYLSHLALAYPHLLNPPSPQNPNPGPTSTTTTTTVPSSAAPSAPESDASKFSLYLSYLYTYWRRPEYARFLTHPGATLRNLELLQEEGFRRDVIRPGVIERLLAVWSPQLDEKEGGEGVKEGQENTEAIEEEKESAVKQEKTVDGQERKMGINKGAG